MLAAALDLWQVRELVAHGLQEFVQALLEGARAQDGEVELFKTR